MNYNCEKECKHYPCDDLMAYPGNCKDFEQIECEDLAISLGITADKASYFNKNEEVITVKAAYNICKKYIDEKLSRR